MAEQFPFSEIVNEDERLIRGWISLEEIDSQGEFVPIEELQKVMNTWMRRGAPITDQHTNRIIGRGLNWEISEKNGKKGIVITAEIFKDYPTDDEAWEKIKQGDYSGFSIGGAVFGDKEFKHIKGKQAGILRGIALHEIATVEKPANPSALIEQINFIAKSLKEKEKNILNQAANVLKRVERRGNRWCVVHCSGPNAGKSIKCFNTKSEADRMHRAIMANMKKGMIMDCVQRLKEKFPSLGERLIHDGVVREVLKYIEYNGDFSRSVLNLIERDLEKIFEKIEAQYKR